MSSESETEQHLMDSDSEEEQNGSESEAVESENEEEVESENEEEVESENEEEGENEPKENSNSEVEEEDSDAESDSKDDEVESGDDMPANSKSHEKEENISLDKKISKWKKEIFRRYEELMNRRSLFIHFPYDIPDPRTLQRTAKRLCSRIIYATRTKNNPRYCFVHFNSLEDRTIALEELRKLEVKGRKLLVSLPGSKPVPKSTLFVKNIPEKSTIADIKELFPNAVDIKISFAQHPGTVKARVTLPTAMDAALAKRNKYNIGENILKIFYEIPGKDIEYKEEYFRTLKQTPDQKNGHGPGSTNFNGKRKLDEPSDVENPSPKKEKKDNNKQNGEEKKIESKDKNKNVQKIKKNMLTKEPGKNKGLNKTDIKHSKSMSKEIKNKKNIKKIVEDTVVDKKKAKKEKLAKPLKLKKPKVK